MSVELYDRQPLTLLNGSTLTLLSGDALEMLPAYAVYVQAYLGGEWVDITEDVRSAVPVVARWGIWGDSPTDRVAQTGTCTFALDNSADNSAGLIGYYSPDHTNARSGWDIGTRIRLAFVDNGSGRHKFYGRVDSIKPTVGLYGERLVQVTAVDWMDEAAGEKITGLTVQQNVTGDTLMTAIVDAMSVQPEARSFDAGPYVYPYALSSERDEKTTAMALFQKICQSGLEYVYLRDGETLKYESNHQRALNLTPVATLNDDMVDMDVVRERSRMYADVVTETYPAEVDTSPVVLARSQAQIKLNPGETQTITLRYRDNTERSQRVSGINMIQPVAGTDYNASPIEGGTDGALNDQISVTATFGANSADVTLTNNGQRVAYIAAGGLQLRGYGIYLYESVSHTASGGAGRETLNYRMPYVDDANIGRAAAKQLVSEWGSAQTQVKRCTFVANKTAALATAAMSVQCGDRVTITESVTGLNDDYFVHGIELSLQNGILNCTWLLVKADETEYYQIGHATYGVLGSYTLRRV